jgi:hypothetical protein
VNEWVWSIGGMVLTGETEVLGEKHYIAWVVGEWMGMERWWNDTDRGKLKCWKKNLSYCHFIHHKSHMDWPGVEVGPPPWEADYWPPETWRYAKWPLCWKWLNFNFCSDTVRTVWVCVCVWRETVEQLDNAFPGTLTRVCHVFKRYAVRTTNRKPKNVISTKVLTVNWIPTAPVRCRTCCLPFCSL